MNMKVSKKKKVFRYKVRQWVQMVIWVEYFPFRVNVTLVATQYSKFMGSYCDTDTIYKVNIN